MLSAGTYLNNRYEIVRRIGTGGMADVYRGKDHKLRRYVAIKVLKPDFAEDESFVRKFQIEAQAAAGMLHPNVVNVYDVGEDHGYNYMVMELVDGITLKEYIQKKGHLTDKETIRIAIQMAAGLDAAHKKQLVHRDVKPQNVMISNEGKVKVTDFGIAKPTTSNTISANVMGSVHYTSPEQARGGVCDIQSDIYSTGITIYEMITGTVPFDGETTVSIAVKHLQEEILPPSEYVPNMYYSLEQIILKCTQKNPSKRYLTMDDLMLDLKHALMDPDGDFVDMGGLNYQNMNKAYYSDEDDYEDDEDNYDYEDDDDSDYDGKYSGSRRNKSSNGDDVDPRMKNITKILTIVVAVIVIFTVIFISIKAIGFFGNGPGEDVPIEELEDGIEVPSLEGKTEDEAKKLLEEIGLKYKVKGREESPKYEEGLIVSQDISKGELVEKETTVNVIVSSGITTEVVNVPVLVGLMEDEAQKLLHDNDLKMDSRAEYSDSVEQGKIISVEPAEGTEVAKESTVMVVVSKGEEPTPKVKVPKLIGETVETAKNALETMSLKIETTEEYSEDVPKGTIISQDIEEGDEIEEGSTVTCVVSKGPEVKKVIVPTLIGVPAQGVAEEMTTAGLKVTVEEKYDSSVTAGYVISANVSAGAELPEGSSVTLVVSKGPEPKPDPKPDTSTDKPTTGND